MSTRILQRKLPSHRRSVDPANALYGYDYRPDWPSLLSVAHDEMDGSRLYLITDRPCLLNSPVLPLEVAGLAILTAAPVLPVKFLVTLSDAVPRGSAWRWMGGSLSLYDPITGAGVNAASGYCADIPGPYTPPPTANVIGSTGSGTFCTLTFDQNIVLNGGLPDDAIVFDGVAPISVGTVDPTTVGFNLSNTISSGSTWAIVRQPGWMISGVTVPQNGVF